MTTVDSVETIRSIQTPNQPFMAPGSAALISQDPLLLAAVPPAEPRKKGSFRPAAQNGTKNNI